MGTVQHIIYLIYMYYMSKVDANLFSQHLLAIEMKSIYHIVLVWGFVNF